MVTKRTEIKTVMAITALFGAFGLVSCSSTNSNVPDNTDTPETGGEVFEPTGSQCAESTRTTLSASDTSALGISGQDVIDWLEPGLTGKINFQNDSSELYTLTATTTSIDYVEYVSSSTGTENSTQEFALCDAALEVGIDMTFVAGELFNESFSGTLISTNSSMANFHHKLMELNGNYSPEEFIDVSGQSNIFSTLSLTIGSGVWNGTINASGEMDSGTEVVTQQTQLVGELVP